MLGPKTTVRVVRGARDARNYRRQTIGPARIVPKAVAGSGGRAPVELGYLLADLDPCQLGTLRLVRQDGNDCITGEAPGPVDIQVRNYTDWPLPAGTSAAGPYMETRYFGRFNQPGVSPHQISDCFQETTKAP